MITFQSGYWDKLSFLKLHGLLISQRTARLHIRRRTSTQTFSAALRPVPVSPIDDIN
jgi:hypothetical protein